MHRRNPYRRAGARPRRQLPGTSPLPPNQPHPQACHCEPARTLVWQSVPLQAARLARPGRGAIPAWGHDRPRGRCNAAHCRGADCHVAALLAMTVSEAGAFGRGCQANLQLPGRVMTLPYGHLQTAPAPPSKGTRPRKIQSGAKRHHNRPQGDITRRQANITARRAISPANGGYHCAAPRSAISPANGGYHSPAPRSASSSFRHPASSFKWPSPKGLFRPFCSRKSTKP